MAYGYRSGPSDRSRFSAFNPEGSDNTVGDIDYTVKEVKGRDYGKAQENFSRLQEIVALKSAAMLESFRRDELCIMKSLDHFFPKLLPP